MENQPSAWEQHVRSLENSTGRFGGEGTIRCHVCGRWVDADTMYFSRYTGDPLCTGCLDTSPMKLFAPSSALILHRILTLLSWLADAD